MSATLRPVFDSVMGYLALTEGRHRQVIARAEEGVFYTKYKQDGWEYPFTLDGLMQAYLQPKM